MNAFFNFKKSNSFLKASKVFVKLIIYVHFYFFRILFYLEGGGADFIDSVKFNYPREELS